MFSGFTMFTTCDSVRRQWLELYHQCIINDILLLPPRIHSKAYISRLHVPCNNCLDKYLDVRKYLKHCNYRQDWTHFDQSLRKPGAVKVTAFVRIHCDLEYMKKVNSYLWWCKLTLYRKYVRIRPFRFRELCRLPIMYEEHLLAVFLKYLTSSFKCHRLDINIFFNFRMAALQKQ